MLTLIIVTPIKRYIGGLLLKSLKEVLVLTLSAKEFQDLTAKYLNKLIP